MKLNTAVIKNNIGFENPNLPKAYVDEVNKIWQEYAKAIGFDALDGFRQDIHYGSFLHRLNSGR
jgi:hypothetical protein